MEVLLRFPLPYKLLYVDIIIIIINTDNGGVLLLGSPFPNEH